MTLEKAIELLKTEYEKASESNYVYNPLAYALYQVWKIADSEVIGQILPQTDLTNKCGACEFAMPIKGSTKGVFGCYIECRHPDKVWKYTSSSRKQRTNPKCSLYQQKVKGDEQCPEQ
jgi:hypothetical protein